MATSTLKHTTRTEYEPVEHVECCRCGQDEQDCICHKQEDENGLLPCFSCGEFHGTGGPLCTPCYEQSKRLADMGRTPEQMAGRNFVKADAIVRAWSNENGAYGKERELV